MSAVLFRRCVVNSALCALVFSGTAAFARELPNDDVTSVYSRPRPEYTPLGVPVGSYNLFPKLAFSLSTNDNVYALDGNEVDDRIFRITPGVELKSAWVRHQLNFQMIGERGYYREEPTEDYGDFLVGTTGRLDILRDTFLSGGLFYADRHEERGSPDATAGLRPTKFTEWNAYADFSRAVSRVALNLTADFTQLNYYDVPRSGLPIADQDFRDRDEYDLTARVGYEFIPNYQAFLQGTYYVRDYHHTGPVDRENKGYEVSAGTAINISGITKGEVFAGYFDREYDDSALDRIDGISVGGSLLWNVTPLTSVRSALSRTIEETTITTSSGYVSTAFTLGLEHELRDNFLVNVNAGFTNNDYEGGPSIQRDDDIINAGVGLDYTVARGVEFGLRYDFTDRDSNIALDDYHENEVTLTTSFAY